MMFRWNIFIALFLLLILEGCAQKEADTFVIAKYHLLKTGEDEGYPYVKVYVSTVDTSWKMKEIFWDSAYSTQLSRMFFHHSVAEGPFLGFVQGRVSRQGFYKNGKRDGEFLTFSAGRVMTRCFYKKGRRTGEWLEYDQDGEVRKRILYDSNGEVERVFESRD